MTYVLKEFGAFVQSTRWGYIFKMDLLYMNKGKRLELE
jgi:hypothetical protein